MKKQKQISTKAALKRLWKDEAAIHKGLIATAFVLMTIVAITTAAYPIIIQSVFDALDNANTGAIWAIPPIIALVAGIKAAAMYFQTRQITALALNITTAIQKKMAAKLINADLDLLMMAPAGEMVSRIMNDVIIVRETVKRLANNLVRDSLTIIAMLATMIWFDWLLTAIVIGIYPIALKPIIATGKKQRKRSTGLQEHTAELTTQINEIMFGQRIIRAYKLESHEIKRNEVAFDQLFKRIFRIDMGRARIESILEALGGIAVAAVIALASWRIVNGKINIGDVAGFITALIMMVRPVRGLGTLNTVVEEAVAALNRIFSHLDKTNKIIDPKNPKKIGKIKGHLTFTEVGFNYGKTAAIKNITFTAKPGETIALVGPSGAGKTTIINLVPRFFDCHSGNITIDNINIKEMKITDLREQMALVSQESILFNNSVRNNIRLGRLKASDDEVTTAAINADAHDFIQNMPQGYNTIIGEAGSKISGGQRQRIAIARAMLKNAPILLLDEATSALDAQSETQIQKALERLTLGRTTIVVAHRLATVKKADRILVIDKGKIVENGKHNALMKQGGLYAKLAKLQHFGD